MTRAGKGVQQVRRRQAATGRDARRSTVARGFTFVEIIVAAVVLFIASIGVLQSLMMMVRHSEHHQRDIQADQLLRTTLGYLRDVGYDGLVASGSPAVATSIATQYSTQLSSLGAGAALGLSWQDSMPGKLLDATVSVSWKVDDATQSLTMATRIAKGGLL